LKCTNKVAVLDCPHLKPPNVREKCGGCKYVDSGLGKAART
jgi:hypothetical protein